MKGGPSAAVPPDEWTRVERYAADADGACDEAGCVSSELVQDIFRAGGFLRRHFVWPEAARTRAARSALTVHDDAGVQD